MRLSDPRVNIPASALMHAGLSAYGNALDENQYEKADGRIILESLMAGLGAAGGAAALRGMSSIGPAVVKGTVPRRNRAMMRLALQNNPELENLRRALPAIAALTASGTGAAVAGQALAPFIASNLNALGAPSMSGRQQDYYEEDRPALTEEEIDAIAAAVMSNG